MHLNFSKSLREGNKDIAWYQKSNFEVGAIVIAGDTGIPY